MGDAENALPPSKKRVAGRQISKENPELDDEEDISEQESGTFKRASDEVLASRRIVKVRRNPTTSTASSNPFAGICLVPPTGPTAAPTVTTSEVDTSEKAPGDIKNDTSIETEKGKDVISKQSESKSVTVTAGDEENNQVVDEATDTSTDIEKPAEDDKGENEKPAEDDKGENEKPAEDGKGENEKPAEDDEGKNETPARDDRAENEKASGADKTEHEDKDNGSENVSTSAEGTPLSSFQQLSSSQNAFTGLAGTGFSTSTFTFGSITKDGTVVDASAASLFGQKIDQPSFGFGLSTNGSSSLFNASGSSLIRKNEGSGFTAMQEVAVETGEENERVAFSADSVLFEFFDGGWKERGKGEVKVNVSSTGAERARLIMRARGNYRLILNASLYPDMKLTNMDKRGITFACINSISEGKDGLSTFALKFKDGSVVEEFRVAVTEHKGKTATVLKTPENSPKASDE